MTNQQTYDRPGRLIARGEKPLMRWPDLAKLIFPHIQEMFPEWRGRSLAEFVKFWPMPCDLDGWVEIRSDEQ